MKNKSIKYMIFAIIAIVVVGGFYIGAQQLKNDQQNQPNEEIGCIAPPGDPSLFEYENSRFEKIYLAGGCFWGVQTYFDRIIGVEYTNVGYANGLTDTTNYESVAQTEHAETVYVVYDPDFLSLEDILTYFFQIIDPTVLNRQANDIGIQYRTGIFYVNSEEKEIIEDFVRKQQLDYDEPIVTQIEPLQNYILAEDYHQDYLDKNPWGYCHVDLGNIPNEKPRATEVDFPRPTQEKIKEMLTDEQYRVTQQDGTEERFSSSYLDMDEKGLFVDIVTGEPLFTTDAIFDSGSGWPSFTKPIDRYALIYLEDLSLGIPRTEVRSAIGDSHLGHVFLDGPQNEGGLRFCINGAALRFIPYDEMIEQGYEDHMAYFKK